MFDFDAGKFLIIGVVALIVIGPKELPRVLRQVGQTVARVRRMAAEFQGQFMDAMKEADLDSIRQDLKKIGDQANIDGHFDPVRDVQRELTASIESASATEPVATATLPAATEGFALPPVPAVETAADAPEAEPETVAASGIAPVAEGLSLDLGEAVPVPDLAASSAADETAMIDGAAVSEIMVTKKRKILMPKRRSLAVPRIHAVYDRTAIAGRSRPLRGQEFAGR